MGNMNNILSFTEKAINQINQIMKDAPSDSAGIVVGVDKSGCSGFSYKIDYAKNTDINNYELIFSGDVNIFIHPNATMFLIGSEMDYTTDKLSSKFVFKNPNQKTECGCGESFSI